MGHKRKKKATRSAAAKKAPEQDGRALAKPEDNTETGTSLLRTAEREAHLIEELEALRLENQRLTRTV